jgi:Reverse transcriptase (RNA-dependent DNA polymerase)
MNCTKPFGIAGQPCHIVPNIIRCWCSKLFVAVRWNNHISRYFHVSYGVGQGSLKSPYLFHLFINILIRELIPADNGFHIENKFYGCFLHADDVIILSPSVGVYKVCLIPVLSLVSVFVYSLIPKNPPALYFIEKDRMAFQACLWECLYSVVRVNLLSWCLCSSYV